MACQAAGSGGNAPVLSTWVMLQHQGDFLEHGIDFCYYIKLLTLQMVFFEVINADA